LLPSVTPTEQVRSFSKASVIGSRRKSFPTSLKQLRWNIAILRTAQTTKGRLVCTRIYSRWIQAKLYRASPYPAIRTFGCWRRHWPRGQLIEISFRELPPDVGGACC